MQLVKLVVLPRLFWLQVDVQQLCSGWVSSKCSTYWQTVLSLLPAQKLVITFLFSACLCCFIVINFAEVDP